MGILEEFRKFTLRGNVVDVAVGIIIGAAFTRIASSLVADVVTPPIGLLIGGVDFSDLALTLKDATASQPAVVLGYGKFIQALMDFTIVAVVVFLMVKGINSIKRRHPEDAAPPPPPQTPAREEQLLTEIRDLLKQR